VVDVAPGVGIDSAEQLRGLLGEVTGRAAIKELAECRYSNHAQCRCWLGRSKPSAVGATPMSVQVPEPAMVGRWPRGGPNTNGVLRPCEALDPQQMA
jgi:hypothetical protein